ncbi:MAG: DUF4421 domain-containing protein [Ginsengibacter sp.]
MLVIKPGISIAQKDTTIDNGYYITYPDKLMVRLFLSQKYAPFTISAPVKELNYKTNSKLNLGIGATYRSFTLNVSYGFKFLTKENGKTQTKGLDFQLHQYPHQWAIDLLGTFRKGYNLDPKNNDKSGLNLVNYYQRPDVKRDIVGFSVFRVPNSGKFSYRAALTQNDWQTKSAGSLLFGGEAYYGMMKGDSALVPARVSSSFEQAGIDKINFLSIGPGVGYAYTLVLEKNFFITGSVIGSLAANFSTEQKAGEKNKEVALIPDAVYKGAIGYNSADWSVSANIIGNALYVGSKSSSKEYFLPTGTLRFIIARKFGHGH